MIILKNKIYRWQYSDPLLLLREKMNLILDVQGLYPTGSACKLEEQINQITGTVTNGLFAIKPADILFLATQQGIVTHTANP